MSDIIFVDNSAAVLDALAAAKASALSSLGAAAVGFARMNVPVDTGRLRDSIGYSVTDDAVSVGSAVDYAAYVEFGVLGRPGAHYLRDAMAMHVDEYAAILEAVFGGEVIAEDAENAGLEGGEENGSEKTMEESGKAE